MIQEEQEQEQDQNDQKKPIPKKQHQHHQHQTSDGPAIIFEADPKITDIFTCKDGDYFGLVLVTNWPHQSPSPSPSPSPSLSSSSSSSLSLSIDGKSSIDGPYQNFLKHVKKCFNTEDISSSSSSSNVSASSSNIPPSWSTTTKTNLNSNSNDYDDTIQQQQQQEQQEQEQPYIPAVYLYPTIHLHITIATFLPPTKTKNNDIDDDDDDEDGNKNKIIINHIIALLNDASKLSDWPKQPFQFVVDSTQLGSKAGILLWKDLSGGINKIRNCLRQVFNSNSNSASATATAASASAAASATSTVSTASFSNVTQQSQQTEAQLFPPIIIPGIIHSTFLRFSRIPKTCGKIIQERFQSEVIPNLNVCFNNTNNNNNNNNNNDNDNTNTIDDRSSSSNSSSNSSNNTGMVIVSNTVKLVCESTPYMHIPADDQHVLWSKSLQ